MDHAYKGQLQTYALKRNLELPVYATERQGPPHDRQFRCKVTFSGQTFQSQDFFPTLKAAEHAAAKIAFDSLALLSQEGTDVSYKNLLQEIAQKENAPFPLYLTVKSGAPHTPVFTSTAEFAGKVFRGEETKTKKSAELSAAKVAFMSLRNGNSNQTASPSLPCERQEATNSNVKSSPQKIHFQPSKLVTPDIPSKWVEIHEDEPKLADVLNAPASIAKEMTVASPVPENLTDVGTLTAPATNGMKMNVAASSSPMPENHTDVGTLTAPATNGMKMNVAASSSPMPENPTDVGALTAPATTGMKMNIAASSSPKRKNPTNDCDVEESEKKKLIMGTSHVSIPSGQHVVCRPWNLEMTLPQDTKMVFRDDTFIAYRHM